MGVSQDSGYPVGGPYNKDHSVWGSIRESPYLREITIYIYMAVSKNGASGIHEGARIGPLRYIPRYILRYIP